MSVAQVAPDPAPPEPDAHDDASRALKVSHLKVSLGRGKNALTLVDDVSFSVRPGEIFGLVGESGSGKSVSALAAMRLLGPRLAISGSVTLAGKELLSLSESQMREVRGRQVSMIFQEPTAALNPVFTIGTQIVAAIRSHLGVSRAAARTRASDLLRQVGIPDPRSRLAFYPHQLSGGMCQRVMIAMALASGAKFIIADEPTTALDVTIQAEIVRLLRKICAETGVGMLFISHDLGLISELCDRVAVMYAGQVVESGPAAKLLRQPAHPYMHGLRACIADLDDIGIVRSGIQGAPPMSGAWPEGCRFQPRCPLSGEGCERPQALNDVMPQHAVRCWRADRTSWRDRAAIFGGAQ